MATSVEKLAAQSSAHSRELVSPASPLTAMKREHSPSPSQNGKQENEQAATPHSQPVEPTTKSSVEPATYGVYQHNLLGGSDQDDAKLIATSANRDDAHDSMRNHAVQLINENPRWGATKEHSMHNIYEITDSNHRTQLRYDISPIVSIGSDDNGDSMWQRDAVLTTAPKHYGIYFSLHPKGDKNVETKEQFLGGYTCLAQATYAMIMSARAFMTRHSDSTVQDRSLELLDRTGRPAQSYWIEEGRLVHGIFVREDKWEALLHQRDQGTYVPCLAKRKRHYVLRMPTPEPPAETTVSEETIDAEPDAEHAHPTPPPEVAGQVVAAAEYEHEDKDDDDDDDDPTKQWCKCRHPDDGSLMICCANENKCPVKWYHAHCLAIHAAPETWLCPACNPAENTTKKTAAKMKGKNPAPGKIARKQTARKSVGKPAATKQATSGGSGGGGGGGGGSSSKKRKIG
ncbi:hypothetical protein J1614_004707 [Plenodomus biglobosus]|nr:hypothetical protein J1614_004707 [Plenodomus biglobosus]